MNYTIRMATTARRTNIDNKARLENITGTIFCEPDGTWIRRLRPSFDGSISITVVTPDGDFSIRPDTDGDVWIYNRKPYTGITFEKIKKEVTV